MREITLKIKTSADNHSLYMKKGLFGWRFIQSFYTKKGLSGFIKSLLPSTFLDIQPPLPDPVEASSEASSQDKDICRQAADCITGILQDHFDSVLMIAHTKDGHVSVCMNSEGEIPLTDVMADAMMREKGVLHAVIGSVCRHAQLMKAKEEGKL